MMRLLSTGKAAEAFDVTSQTVPRWIEGAHDRKDGQRILGKLTPIEYEAIMKQTAPIAA
ncbi:hypothetical protein QEV61_04360 [Trueperella pyogenes]|uniref:hypothetical protein n=2 Tax=Trueperella pyogenes TaxID=1661 RepID=UPI000DFDA352|nr:Uncharacterised protein [Trueperella pyogenes]